MKITQRRYPKLKWIILSLTILFIVVIIIYIYSLLNFGMKIHKEPEEVPLFTLDGKVEPFEFQIPEWEGKDRVNLLLLGLDGRDKDFGNTDTMMVVSIDPEMKQLHLLSVLRDTFVNIENKGDWKINAAYRFGGPQLSMKTISELIGQPIHYYLSIDFEGFIQLIDAIGGIDFEVEKDMRYFDPTDKPEYNIDLKKGLQHLDGNKALQYVRFRYDRLSDYTRTERQREFLKAVADKLKSTTTLINLPNTLNKLAPYLETNMDLSDMLKLAKVCYNINIDSIQTVQIPPMNLLKEDKVRGMDVILVDSEKLKIFVEEIFNKSDLAHDE